MNTFNELLMQMSENERMDWIVNAKTSYLDVVLKDCGVKGIANMKKLEKIVMVTKLVVENSVADEEIDAIWEDAKRLNKDLNYRNSYKESIDATLYAMYKSKEINFNEFRKVCDRYHLDIPCSYNETHSIDIINKCCSYYLHSNYEHYDCNNNAYYSLFDECYQWDNIYRKDNICEDEDWDLKQFYAKNTVDDDGYLQLAYAFNDDGHYVLCVYKHYELLATYEEGCMEDIEHLAVYDYRLDDDDLLSYKELFESLGKQYEEHCEIMYIDEMLQKKLKIAKGYNRPVIIDALNRSKC